MIHRVAVVCGGSAGVGFAVVEQLLARGYRVAIFARGKARLDEMASRFGEKVLTIPCDVSKANAVSDAAQHITQELGTPTIWVNCAMLTAFSAFRDMSSEEFDAITDTTYHGQVNGTRAALSVMDAGSIVNVGSGLSYTSVPFQSAYCGAKHAINGFTSSLRSELLREGSKIKLSLVQLPAINTPQFGWARNRLDNHPQPAPPIFQPSVAANAVLKAIDKGSRELFVGQSVLKLVFGNMVVPDYVDRKLADDGVPMQKSDMAEPGFREGNIDGPVEKTAGAEGAFSDRASDKGLIVDADMARYVVFFGGAALIFLLGLLLG